MEKPNRNKKLGMPVPMGAGMPMPSPVVEDEVKDASDEIEVQSPVTEVSEIQSTPQNHSVKVVKAPSKGIQVMATRPGFFKNARKVAGDVFFVPSMEKLGSWMECVDPQLEKQHKQMMAEKKKKIAAGV